MSAVAKNETVANDAMANDPVAKDPIANEAFIDCWNAILTPKWVKYRHLLSGNGGVFSDMVYPKPQEGQRVLDVASGFGENSLEFAEQVAFLDDELHGVLAGFPERRVP
jgi:hypothetical protein